MPAIPICYFDLDKTLYNTNLFVADIENYLRAIGHDDVSIRRALHRAIERGYSFERHLRFLEHPEYRIPEHLRVLDDLLDHGERYLLTGVGDGLRRLSDRAFCHLLSSGDPKFQYRKFRGARIHPYFSSDCFVWKRFTKGDVIRDHGPRPHTWFLEDLPEHLEDVRQKAPWVACVRMRAREVRAEHHHGDGEHWAVVQTFAEFVELVLNTN